MKYSSGRSFCISFLRLLEMVTCNLRVLSAMVIQTVVLTFTSSVGISSYVMALSSAMAVASRLRNKYLIFKKHNNSSNQKALEVLKSRTINVAQFGLSLVFTS